MKPTFLLLIALALPACTATTGVTVGGAVNAFDKGMSWVCGAWSVARPYARSLIPADSGVDTADDASAPASSGGAQ